MSERFTKVPINLLTYSGRNPRHEMRGLEELAGNITRYGVLQPIIVRPKGDRFEVVVGERRLRAAVMAGLREVPAIVKEITDREADELRLVENLHRDDLTDAEKGDAVYGLLEAHPEKYKSIADVAKAITTLYETVLRWCRQSRKLSSHVRELIALNLMQDGHAIYLLKYDHTTQDKLADVIMRKGIRTTVMSDFIRLYDANPEANLDDLAERAKSVEKVKVELAKLPPEVRKTVEKVVVKREKEVKKVRRKALEKAWKAPRTPRPKPTQEKLPTPTEAEMPIVPPIEI
ncbi:MAG: ParB/RepB/Spo0J family partition protein, partial [archaeon]|nr:ParB/RepB/Spo0J family partition protein [archaeon]